MYVYCHYRLLLILRVYTDIDNNLKHKIESINIMTSSMHLIICFKLILPM